MGEIIGEESEFVNHHRTPDELIEVDPDYIEASMSTPRIWSGLGRSLHLAIKRERPTDPTQVSAIIAVDKALQDLANPPSHRHDEQGA